LPTKSTHWNGWESVLPLICEFVKIDSLKGWQWIFLIMRRLFIVCSITTDKHLQVWLPSMSLHLFKKRAEISSPHTTSKPSTSISTRQMTKIRSTFSVWVSTNKSNLCHNCSTLLGNPYCIRVPTPLCMKSQVSVANFLYSSIYNVWACWGIPMAQVTTAPRANTSSNSASVVLLPACSWNAAILSVNGFAYSTPATLKINTKTFSTIQCSYQPDNLDHRLACIQSNLTDRLNSQQYWSGATVIWLTTVLVLTGR